MIKILKNLTKQARLFALGCLLLVIAQVWLELTMPDYTQKLTASVSSGAVTMTDVWQNGGMMLLCALGSLVCSLCCGFLAARIAASLAKTLRWKLFDRISSFAAAEINRFTTPSLITRTTNDVVQLQMLVAIGLQMIIRAPIMAIWAITKISSSSVAWTAAALIAVITVVVCVGIVVGLCFPRFRKIQKLTDDLNNVTRENLNGVRVVRAFNAEDYQQDKFAAVNNSITANHLFTARAMGLLMPVLMVVMNGLTLAIYWIGAVLINQAPLMEKAAVMGNMIAFTQYAMQIVMSFIMLVAIFILLPRTMVSARRINEVLDTNPGITYTDTPAAPQSKGRIEFRNVSFAYNDTGAPCLRDLSFTIEPGETFAIIGATGTGKSSLVNLIPRFYDATGGSILIDGIDIRSYPREQLEQKISLAPQKAILFKGDIKSNITYGCKTPVSDDDPRIQRALSIAKADFVEELSDGIHAPVAQGGSNFSGGQKQRLSIARAVFKPADILIFDDTFSALDYKTDLLVRRALRKNLEGATVLIVAQRIGTIRDADHILVLEDGRIAGIGCHAELLETCPLYREIALSQLSKEEL
ncbi:MAG: ABC transporter ATP-binding protein/permease [Oscillospiraceae bacterium]|nr:ABC transporter ATP-binding protein/permease [Oscillospiraceae bacterium]